MMDLVEELAQIVSRLREGKVEFALCGGLAMAVYAFPRATLDIDIMIQPAALRRAKQVASELGFSHDSGLMRFQKGAIQIHRLCKIAQESGETLVLDLVLATPQMKEVWKSRRKVRWDRGIMPVVSPEGLIRMKSMRNSGQDRDDIEHLRKLSRED